MGQHDKQHMLQPKSDQHQHNNIGSQIPVRQDQGYKVFLVDLISGTK